VSLNDKRITDSHDFGNLLDSQLEATFKGNLIDVHIRTFKLNVDSYLWQDSSSDNYLHCPRVIESKSAYEMVMYYTKLYMKEAPGKVSNH
jgi:hypothetical protein